MHAGGYFRIGNNNTQTIGASLRYFTMGKLTTWDASGRSLGVSHPNEFAIDASYARKLSPNFSLAVALRYIHSDQGAVSKVIALGQPSQPTSQATTRSTSRSVGLSACGQRASTSAISARRSPLTEGRLPPSSPRISVWVRDSSTPSTRRT